MHILYLVCFIKIFDQYTHHSTITIKDKIVPWGQTSNELQNIIRWGFKNLKTFRNIIHFKLKCICFL